MEKITGTAVGLGCCFFVVFWLIFDSLALGIALGVSLGIAFSVSPLSDKDETKESE